MLQEPPYLRLTLASDATPFIESESRRQFISQASKGLLAASVASALPLAAAEAAAPPPPAGSTDVKLPDIKSATDPKTGPLPNPAPPAQRVGYAVVGLGRLTLGQILPALEQCKHSKLVALVSGDADKMGKVAQQYGVSSRNCYSYKDYDKLKDNKEVEVIYIVLPNSLHHEYTIRGAKAGKHILCEKPMATSVKECEEMIEACKKANVKLMIAYRIQYEPNNTLVKDMVRKEEYGKVKYLDMTDGQSQGDPQHWRLKKALAGGGPLPDAGLYCLNTARFLLGEEPVEVYATLHENKADPRFKEVEEGMTFTLRFPNDVVANCFTSYNSYDTKRYRVYAETGWVGMDPAFPYKGLKIERAHAPEPANIEVRETPGVGDKDHFATEMDHFSQCVRQNRQPYTPGEEGLQDQRIIEALYLSARENRPVKLPAVSKKDAFRGPAPEAG
jgi:predicted dehydrogenase